MKARFFLVMLALTLCISCQKEEIKPDNKNPGQDKHSLKAAYMQTPFFDWENETFISYQGASWLLPWTSGANADIPMDIKPDFRRADGWRLLYNTFPLNEADPTLILYNTYTGTVRAYFFITNTVYTNNMWTWGFGAGTTSSSRISALNFAWALPSPLNVKKDNPHVFKVNWCSDPSVLPSGIVPGYWYCCEFELAYDPNIVNLNHDQLEFQFRGFASQKQAVVTNGTINGTIKGTFDMPKSTAAGGLLTSFADFPWSSAPKDSARISLMTKNEATNYLLSKISGQTNTTLKNLLTTGLNALIGNALTLSNPILKIITSSIFSPSSNVPSGYMKLTLGATTSSNGTISSTYPGPTKSFFFPGSQQSSNKGGYLPYYNYNLGVWNIDQTPVVKYSVATIQRSTDRTKPEIVTQTYTLNASSFNILINPLLTGVEHATITSMTKEIVFYKKNTRLTTITGELIDSEVNSTAYKSSSSIITTYSGLPLGNSTTYNYGPDFGIFRIRVTVAIRPSGSSQDVILVKEFPIRWIAQ